MKKIIILIVFSVSSLASGHNKPEAEIRPNLFPVYKDVDFEVIISPNQSLKTGELIECQLANSFNAEKISPSITKNWQFNNPKGINYIGVSCKNNEKVKFSLSIKKREFVGGYQAETRHGLCLNIKITDGMIAPDDRVIVSYKNTTTPWRSIEDPGSTIHEGTIYVAINGTPVEKFPHYRVFSGEETQFRGIGPSSVRPGELFPVKLISLDQYNNLTYTTHSDVSVTLNSVNLASGINFCGRGEIWISLPEKGVYRLEAKGVISNPIKVVDEPNGPYWGDIHFHNYMSVDAMGNDPYGYARDVSCLDFAATSEHVAGGLELYWKQTLKWAEQFNKPGEFVTIIGLETSLEMLGSPHYNMYLPVNQAPALYGTENGTGENASLDIIGKYSKEFNIIGQIHHTGWGFGGFDMRLRYPDELKLLEIYSMHGQAEYYDNKTALSYGKQRHREGGKLGYFYARDAWALGKKLSTVGSSDNHFGQPGVHYNSLCAIYTDQLKRESVLDALTTGYCYATTGERIILEMDVNEKPMGSTIINPPNDSLTFSITVHGTDQLEKLEVFACPFIEGNKDVKVGEMMFAVDDPMVKKVTQSWETIFIQEQITEMDYQTKFYFPLSGNNMVFYARVTQKHPIVLPSTLEGSSFKQVRPVVAWSTPVWVEKN